RDLDEELRAYHEMAAEQKMKDGMSHKEALRAVRLERGSLEVTKEVLWSARWESFVGTLLQDLRIGTRMLRRAPGFTAVAVLTLALGIAVNATMFSLVSAFLLAHPPGREPDRVAVVTTVDPAPVFQGDATPVSAPNYFAWRAANHVFED